MGSDSSAQRRAITRAEALRIAHQRQIPEVRAILEREKWLVGEILGRDPGERHEMVLRRMEELLVRQGVGAWLRAKVTQEILAEFDVVDAPGFSGGSRTAVRAHPEAEPVQEPRGAHPPQGADRIPFPAASPVPLLAYAAAR